MLQPVPNIPEYLPAAGTLAEQMLNLPMLSIAVARKRVKSADAKDNALTFTQFRSFTAPQLHWQRDISSSTSARITLRARAALRGCT